MSSQTVALARVIRVHYGAALKEADRDQAGSHEVFGSSGPVGRHAAALFGYPSIVIGRKGSVGAITYAPQGGWAIDTAFYVERIEPEATDLRYLFYALSSANLARHAITTSIPGLSRDDIYRTRIWLPQLSEQRRIADILDKADAIRRKRKEAITLADELLRSALLDMFGDPVMNPKGWPVRPLGELLAAVDSGWSPVCEARPAANGEWGVLKLGAVTFGRYEEKDNKALPAEVEPVPALEVKPGDVLFSRKNTYEHVAACVFVASTRPKLMLPDLIFRLVLTKSSGLLPEVLWALLSDPRKRKQVQGLAGGTAASMPNISKERLKGVELPVPPPALQRKFAMTLRKHEELRRALESAKGASGALCDSLSSLAFAGQLSRSEGPC